MGRNISRRDMLRFGAGFGVALAAGGAVGGCGKSMVSRKWNPIVTKPLGEVRVGFVGCGGRGMGLIRNLLKVDSARLVAVCDIVAEKCERVQMMAKDAGQAKPVAYTRGGKDYERLCQEADVDIVITATPWGLHVPVCVAAMKNGKHAATEVPAAVTVEECWQLVETSEQTGKHCVMMENCCYGRNELMVLNMCRKGVFGEIVHCEGGYLHDLRGLALSSSGEGMWRTDHNRTRDGNLYPTHGLGPVCQYTNQGRGDRMEYLVSVSSKSRGLNAFAAEKMGSKHEYATFDYKCGDINTSIIKTAAGVTFTVVHDVQLPRPYSRINMIQGTKGVFQDYPGKIHIEGRSKAHSWQDAKEYYEEFDHPLWRELSNKAKGSGHGGMDFVMMYRLIKCLEHGEYPDMDVYDAADWSVVSALSEKSVAGRGKSVDFPDFTRGAWKVRKPLGIVVA